MLTATMLVGVLLLLGACQPGRAQRASTSGGPLLAEQAAYDVTFYDLALAIDPSTRSIEGVLTVQADVVDPLDHLVLDLDTLLSVRGVRVAGEAAAYERRGSRLWIDLGSPYGPGDEIRAEVAYGGAPRVAVQPPWQGGFTWAETADGQPWIATSVQGEGADLWWPVKDHPSDEPDSMALHITVPEPLVVAANGVLRSIEVRDDGRRTYHWVTTQPINNYGVALNIAPYRTIEDTYTSIDGTEVPVTFWVLAEDEAQGRRLFPQFAEHLAFYERYLGPYPFRSEKYGVAHTPFLGMEHQTIIAYGSNFDDGSYGYDWLHHHELGHEWWGNLVTAADWRDFWLHEGFSTYMQALYSEDLFGPERYRLAMQDYRASIRNAKPLAPRTPQTTDDMYFADVARGTVDNDPYYKGAWVLHTLRSLIGDEAFFTALRRMAYPDPTWEARADGSQTRFVTSDDFIAVAEAASGQELDWFFEVYLRQPALPRLVTEREGDRLTLTWDTPENLPFPMPVEVQLGDRRVRVPMEDGRGAIRVPAGVDPDIDPDGWLLIAPLEAGR